MDSDDREEVHQCSKKANTVPEHAKCVVKVLDKTKHLRRVRIVKNKPANHIKRKPLKITIKPSKSKKLAKPEEREWIGGFRMARLKRSTAKVVQRSSYNLASSDDDGTPLSRLAQQMTKTMRKLKNKPGSESWRSAIQRIKNIGAEAKEEKKRRKQLKKRLRHMIDNTPDEFQDPRKPLAMKQMNAQDDEVAKQNKITKRKRDEIRIPMRIVRESIKMALMAAGKNVTNFDKKTLKLVSPRFMSLVPEQEDDDLFNLLSPSLFSLHQDGGELEKVMSLPHILKQLPNKDQEAWMDFIVETAGEWS
ncbi:hypothetical protein ANCDUO_01901 [Ancylostoma duodenale]|uniref:Uncharacterized protein n=1 Tax=Ancylostoma duodenale TaxID=51022 RepID=A0A0C2DD36_9BILA|nr:hypothetical protein ANCDUO_01901 [Ancylostoma duodenale]